MGILSTPDGRILKGSLFARTPELYPLLFCVGFGLTLSAATAIYSLNKNDVVLNHKAKLPPWERMNLEHPQPLKLLIFQQKLEYDPQYRQLKADIIKDQLQH